MALDLERLEQIGKEHKPKSVNDLEYGLIEVLNINKTPFDGVSFLRDGFYQCPFCKNSSIKRVINYVCKKCRSRVIKWKCFVEEVEEKHEYYDHYIRAFYDATDRILGLLKKKKEKDERNISQ